MAGTALGLAGAAAGSSLVSNLLYDVQRVDPATYGAVALVASWGPARRAARLDPVVFLREE